MKYGDKSSNGFSVMLLLVTLFKGFIFFREKEQQYCIMQEIHNILMHIQLFFLTLNNLKTEKTVFEFQ